MKHLIVLFLLVHSVYIGYTQTFANHPVSLAPGQKLEGDFNPTIFRKAIETKFLHLFNKPKDFERFYENCLNIHRSAFEPKLINQDLGYINTYLTSLLNLIVPEKQRIENPLKIYLVRDPDMNLRILPDGSVMLNIGLIAQVHNEAELASLLAHELGHFFSNHDFESYKNARQYYPRPSVTKNLGDMVIDYLAQQEVSARLTLDEQEADNCAIRLMRENKFNPAVLENNFELYHKWEVRSRALLDVMAIELNYFQAHRFTKSAFRKTEHQISEDELRKKSNFFYDSLTFTKIKQRAIDESINLEFENKNYENCVEQSFRQILFYPTDPFYNFYLCESLRRMNFLPRYAKKYFITGRYSNTNKPAKTKVKAPVITGNVESIESMAYLNSFCYRLNEGLLDLNEQDIKLAKNKQLLDTDTLEFLTNKEAQLYFSRTLSLNTTSGTFARLMLEHAVSMKSLPKPTSELEQKYLVTGQKLDTFSLKKEEYKNMCTRFFCLDANPAIGPFGSIKYEVEKRLKDELRKHCALTFDTNAVLTNTIQLGYRDEMEVASFAAFLLPRFPAHENGQSTTRYFEYQELFPELVALAATYKLRKLVLVDVKVVSNEVDPVSGENVLRCDPSIYCIDFTNKTIKYKKSILYLKGKAKFDKIYREIAKMYKDVRN